MKVLLTSLNKKHAFNPIVMRLFEPLRSHFDFVTDLDYSPTGDNRSIKAVFLSFIAPEQDFDLDEPVLEWLLKYFDGKIIIFDHSETAGEKFLIGQAELHTSSYYWPVHEFLLNNWQNRVRGYFKRELPTNGIRTAGFGDVLPIDWTIPAMPRFDGIDTRNRFNARPIDIFMSWGYSSESRPRLYGELVKQAGRFGAHFCLTPEDLETALKEKRERIFALLFTPYYRRLPIEQLMEWQAQSKISISLKGAGYKCFRCAEASYNSVMAHQEPGAVVWSYPWVHGENCLGLPNMAPKNHQDAGLRDELSELASLEVLWHWLREKQGALYDVYTKGIINNRNYHMREYSTDYLLPKLQEALK